MPLLAALDDAAFLTAAAAALAAAASAAVAAWQGVLMKQRAQPHAADRRRIPAGRPRASSNGETRLAVSLANEGAGPAFNVRFGARVAKTEAMYSPRPAGAHGAGDVPRALGPGRTLPESGGTYQLTLVADPERLADRVYWCRYENAFGDSWETRNAWRPDRELEIVALKRR